MACRTGCKTQDHEDWCKHSGPARIQGYFNSLFEKGLWRCRDCAKELPLNKFHVRKNGPRIGKPTAAICKEHYSAFQNPTRRKYKYGISQEKYDELLKSQGGKCAICGTKKGTMCVDHDHSCCDTNTSCGKCIRGLLCTRCNVGIAMFNDSAESMKKAVNYVNTWK